METFLELHLLTQYLLLSQLHKHLHPQSKKQAGNPFGFLIIEENTFGLQQPFNGPQWKNRPWEVMLPQGSLLLYLPHIIVTSAPLLGNPIPVLQRDAISVLPPGLGLDTSYLVISHHRQYRPVISSPSASGRGSWTLFHMHAC